MGRHLVGSRPVSPTGSGLPIPSRRTRAALIPGLACSETATRRHPCLRVPVHAVSRGCADPILSRWRGARRRGCPCRRAGVAGRAQHGVRSEGSIECVKGIDALVGSGERHADADGHVERVVATRDRGGNAAPQALREAGDPVDDHQFVAADPSADVGSRPTRVRRCRRTAPRRAARSPRFTASVVGHRETRRRIPSRTCNTRRGRRGPRKNAGVRGRARPEPSVRRGVCRRGGRGAAARSRS